MYYLCKICNFKYSLYQTYLYKLMLHIQKSFDFLHIHGKFELCRHIIYHEIVKQRNLALHGVPPTRGYYITRMIIFSGLAGECLK